MQEVLSYVVSSIFICISSMYIYIKLHNERVVFNVRLIVTLLIHIVLFTLTPLYLPLFVKQVVNMIILILVPLFGLKHSVKTSILDMAFLEIVCIASEGIYGTICLMVSKNSNINVWSDALNAIIVANVVISILMILLSRFILFRFIYRKMEEITDYLSKNKIVSTIIFFFIIANLVFYTFYYQYYSNKTVLYLIVVSIFFLYSVILFVLLHTSNNYEKMKSKYSLSLENINGYEHMLNQYRISNHENKNQLLLIRNMAKNKKIIKYIDELIDNKDKDDKDIYNIVKHIPSSGIRAVVYSKALIMTEKKISYSVSVGRGVSYRDFSFMSDTLLLDICNILNVFLDNAIDAANDSSKKQILFEISKEKDEIEIAISNLYTGDIDINQIYNPGYTTKGSQHGYGLVVVKKIIDDSRKLSNKTEINKNVFTQYLYINTK